MSTDPSALVAAPTPFMIDGDDYRLYPFRFRELAEFHAWVKTLHPDPRLEARKYMEGMSDAVATHIWDRAVEAARDWPPALDGPEVNAATLTSEGQARLVYIAIKRTMPALTIDQAWDLAGKMSDEDLARFLDIILPKSAPEAGAPKAGAAPG